MAMLSGSRQRKRYNLVPRGKALYEDETRFGTKMLEKMGWKKGQGLGANENGSKDFVRVRYKNDAFGLGFEQRDDQWTQHEENFNGLLKTLNNDDGLNIEKISGNDPEGRLQPRACFGIYENNEKVEATAKVEKMKEKISGVSLEERSKQSKARVHYKKFTKGKDLAQYSEKDLANIFGKKAVDEQQTANDFYHQLNNIFGKNEDNCNDADDINKSKQESMKDQDTEKTGSNIVKEKTYESKVQIFNSNISVNDYFKLKMEAIKNKNNDSNTPKNVANEGNSCKEFNKDKATEAQTKIKNNIEDLENSCEIQTVKKKSKKDKIIGNQEKAILTEIENKVHDNKNQTKSIRITEDTMNTSIDVTKNRKRKEKSQSMIQVDTANENHVTKKRKIDDLAENTISISSNESCSEMNSTQDLTRKKRKKNKTKERNEMIEKVNSDKDNSHDSEKKGKNKKSKRNKKPIEICSNNDVLLTSAQTNLVSNQASEILAKTKTKDVSSTTKNVLISDINFQELDHKEIKETLIQEEPSNESNVTSKRKIDNLEYNTISISSDESCPKINLIQELTTQKRKKNKTKERNEIIETVSSDKDTANDCEKKKGKSKSKRNNENIDVCLNKDGLLNVNKTNEVLNQPLEKSSNNDANFQELKLEESKEKYKASKSQIITQVETTNENNATKEKIDNLEKNIIAISSDESCSEINLVQELTEKRKKNKTKEKCEMTEIRNSDKDKSNDYEKKNSKNKLKRSTELSEICLNKDALLISTQTNEVSNQPLETNRKDMGFSAKNVLISDINLHELDLEEIKEKYKAFNIYRISSFCAEKFRNMNLNNFTGSILPQIEGYGLGPDLQLDVHINKNDEERITNLWKCTLNKYTQLEKPKNAYRNYVREVIKARKSKRKIPKLYVKTWKRKNVFQAI